MLTTLKTVAALAFSAALGWAGAAPFAYIAETGAANVRVIDTATQATVANVAVEIGPFGVAVNNAGTRVYVTNLLSDSVSVIDTTTHEVIATVGVGVGPLGIAVNPAGTRVYVANAGDDLELGTTVSVIDAASDTVVATVTVGLLPVGLAVSPDGARLYVANGFGDAISVVDTASNMVVETIDVPMGPAGLALDPQGTRLYVTHPGVDTVGSTVSVIDTATHMVLASVGVQDGPLGIVVHPDGSRVYVANAGSENEAGNTVSVIDAATLEVTGTVNVGIAPQGLSLHPGGDRLYVTNTFSNTVSVVDTATLAVTATLPVGPSPVSFGSFVGPGAVGANYAGLWWRPTESGWGVNLTQQGGILFATWFTYDTDGSGIWLVMSEGRATGPGTYSGTLYRTTGPPFSANPWDPALVTRTAVGAATFSFADANNGTFSYVVNGIAQSKPITRLVFSTPPVCAEGASHGAAPNYQDLWWRSPAGSESGWGLNIVHQGDIVFATWFTYDASGRGLWIVMEGSRTAAGVYSGSLYRTTGPAFSAIPFDPALVSRIPVGTATLTFSDASTGTFAYTVDGISQAKPIIRLIYALPATVCR